MAESMFASEKQKIAAESIRKSFGKRSSSKAKKDKTIDILSRIKSLFDSESIGEQFSKSLKRRSKSK